MKKLYALMHIKFQNDTKNINFDEGVWFYGRFSEAMSFSKFATSVSKVTIDVPQISIVWLPRVKCLLLLWKTKPAWIMPQSHLLYGGRTVVVELQNRVIPAVAVEILRWPQGHRTANSYVLQAAGVAVEL